MERFFSDEGRTQSPAAVEASIAASCGTIAEYNAAMDGTKEDWMRFALVKWAQQEGEDGDDRY